MFKKAGTNIVAIFDDPIEVNMVMKLGMTEFGHPAQQPFNVLTPNNFKKITQNARVIITDDYEKIYQRPDFAFALTWQGNALFYAGQKNNTYQFLVHPQLSHVSFDLLGVTNNNPSTLCVARVLSSPKAMSLVENTAYYFSPYLDDSKITSPYLKNIYDVFLGYLPTLPRVQPVSRDGFEQLSRQWDIIRLDFSNTE